MARGRGTRRDADLARARLQGGLGTTVAYKGGSEIGVLNLTTQVTGKDGSTYCVAFTWNDSDGAGRSQRLANLMPLLLSWLSRIETAQAVFVFLAGKIRIKHPAHGIVVGEALDGVPGLAVVGDGLVRPDADAVFPGAQNGAVGFLADVERGAGRIGDGADLAIIVGAFAD